MRCKCGNTVYEGTMHSCSYTNNKYTLVDDKFIISFVLTVATDSAILGTLLGGDVIGSILGDVLDGDLFD